MKLSFLGPGLGPGLAVTPTAASEEGQAHPGRGGCWWPPQKVRGNEAVATNGPPFRDRPGGSGAGPPARSVAIRVALVFVLSSLSLWVLAGPVYLCKDTSSNKVFAMCEADKSQRSHRITSPDFPALGEVIETQQAPVGDITG